MLECKDCCLYNTDACRYGRYALEHNTSFYCDDFIVEHNKAYQQGRADSINDFLDWLLEKYYIKDDHMWDMEKDEILKEFKEQSNE